MARAREVLQRLERYELEVFTEEESRASIERAAAAGATESSESDALSKVATQAGRRRIAAQASLFDLANQRVVDELRAADTDGLSPEEAKQLLTELRSKLL
ncbi:MAG: hypothetical protein DMF70_13295 [Acidobacteria bacterium]|nr:MAG: hypothetical protein DMF70_13295 [Acidobacteriota bacterium]